ncbi:MAG: hypothetical protein VX726_06260 [Planctomycetota bacterium]|nr:hypothetical protein [Planctomycetota bacterium]
MSTTPDHDDAPETEATAEDDLVRSVLSDAQDLLGEEPPAAPTSIESMLEEVERLTSSLRSSSEEGSPEGSAPASTESPADADSAFDLTHVSESKPVPVEDAVPDHGPDGPKVDLFAEPPAPEVTPTETINPSLASPTPSIADDASTFSIETTPTDAEVPSEDDSATRLERLMASRLAEEYDQVADVEVEPASFDAEFTEEEATPDELVLAAVGADVGVRMEVVDGGEDPEIGLSSTRVIPASDPATVEHVPVGDVDDSTVATSGSMGGRTGGLTPADGGPDARALPDESSPEEPETVLEDATDPPATAEATDETEPTLEPAGESEAERDASEEIEVVATASTTLPGLFRRVATPLALSLMLWVPIAWTFALVGPKPVEAEVDVLHPGFEGDEVGTTDEASTSKTDDDESIGD